MLWSRSGVGSTSSPMKVKLRIASGHRKFRLTSSMLSSTRCPSPVRSRAYKAAAMLCEAVSAVILSQIKSVDHARARPLLGWLAPQPSLRSPE